MLAFLTPAWIAALDEAARARSSDAAASEVELVVEQRVTGTPEGEVVFHVSIHRGAITVTPGPADDPGLSFRQDYTTARAIAAGTESAQRAFMNGRLQVGGDIRILLARQESLAALDDVFATVRARTDHGPVPLSASPADGG